jgi:hypothetical protein
MLTFDNISSLRADALQYGDQDLTCVSGSSRMRHMAKLLVLLCLLVSAPVALVPFQRPALQNQGDNKAQTVYVTRTGKRYYRDGCRYLATSRFAMSLKDAQAGVSRRARFVIRHNEGLDMIRWLRSLSPPLRTA